MPRVREGLKLTESRVVQHLHNLARALVRPQDGVAWARLLTGPWADPDLAVVAGCARATGTVWPEKLADFATFSRVPGGHGKAGANIARGPGTGGPGAFGRYY